MSNMGKLRYAKYYPCDLVNGEGVRCTLFVTGCIHACAGCHNKSTWNPKSGELVDEELIQRILHDLKDRDGLSLSGGDPLLPRNLPEVTELCRRVKTMYPEKDIWLWTGYRIEEVCHLEIAQYLDVVIDGKYLKDKPTLKPWRGSDNQRLLIKTFGCDAVSAFTELS